MNNAKKLEELTPEQEALCDVVANEYLDDLVRERQPDEKLDDAVLQRWLTIVYALYDQTVPDRVEVVGSPYAAVKLASELTGETVDNTDWCGFGDGGWISQYDYYKRIGVLSEEEAAEILAFREFTRLAYDTLLLEPDKKGGPACAIVVRRPLTTKVDERGDLHNASGPAMMWADGERDYWWHGVSVPERMITDPRSFTRAEYLAITNTEQRRALAEIAGWTWLAELLGATVVDAWTDPVTSLSYELLRCDGGQLLRKQSPALQSGQQPIYVEPVHEDLVTARGARKWQATDWTPERCERDPGLSYGVEA